MIVVDYIHDDDDIEISSILAMNEMPPTICTYIHGTEISFLKVMVGILIYQS